MHGIAECVARCRGKPGSTAFLFANGGYLTKHSFGVYSTMPAYNGRRDPATYQAQIDAMPAPPLVEKPEGKGTVETFTVIHHKGEPAFAIVIGRLDSGERFLSQMHDGLGALIDRPVIGRRVTVRPTDTVNIARFNS
jgi:acetyl-CoA C-acetyltransferase